MMPIVIILAIVLIISLISVSGASQVLEPDEHVLAQFLRDVAPIMEQVRSPLSLYLFVDLLACLYIMYT